MIDVAKVIKGLKMHEKKRAGVVCLECPYAEAEGGTDDWCIRGLHRDILALLKEQEAMVMTLEEVVAHYSLPQVVLDDLGWELEYLSNIKPLYFEYKQAQGHPVHWRNQREAQHCLDHWTELYGKLWRCWSAKPTDEQRQAVKWDE